MAQGGTLWSDILELSEESITFRSDAQGVLQDAIAFRAKEPLLNLRMAEVALTTAPWGIELKA